VSAIGLRAFTACDSGLALGLGRRRRAAQQHHGAMTREPSERGGDPWTGGGPHRRRTPEAGPRQERRSGGRAVEQPGPSRASAGSGSFSRRKTLQFGLSGLAARARKPFKPLFQNGIFGRWHETRLEFTAPESAGQ
jgi:hypothetical protein